MEWKLEDVATGETIEQHHNESKIRESYVRFDMDKRPIRLYRRPVDAEEWETVDWNCDLDSAKVTGTSKYAHIMPWHDRQRLMCDLTTQTQEKASAQLVGLLERFRAKYGPHERLMIKDMGPDIPVRVRTRMVGEREYPVKEIRTDGLVLKGKNNPELFMDWDNILPGSLLDLTITLLYQEHGVITK